MIKKSLRFQKGDTSDFLVLWLLSNPLRQRYSSCCSDSWLVLEDHPCIMYIGTSIWSSMFNMMTVRLRVVFWQPSIPCCLQRYIGLPQQQGGLPQALGWTAFPWQQGSTLDYPCQRGSSGICIPDIAGDNPCDIGPPSHGHWISMLGRQSLVLLCIVRWQSIFVLLCIE